MDIRKIDETTKLLSVPEMIQYSGKRFSVLGDSISTFEGYNPYGYNVFYRGQNCINSGVVKVEDTWWNQVISFLGGELLVNNSWSGSRVTKIPEIDGLFPSGCSDERTSALHIGNEMPDVIIVYMGTNDWAYGVTTGIDTCILNQDKCERFEGAYSEMIKKLKKNYPHSEIWCCTLTTTFMRSNPGFRFPYEFCGNHIEEYNEIIRFVACLNQCSIIDLYSYNQPYDTLDGTHPNRDGMQTLSRLVLREMVGINPIIMQEKHVQREDEYVLLPSGITEVLYSDTLKLTFEDIGGTIKFQKSEVNVGRGEFNDLDFADNEEIEYHHATFFYESDSWFLRDNGSKKGTQMNGTLLIPGKKYQLPANAQIAFGNSVKVIFYKLKLNSTLLACGNLEPLRPQDVQITRKKGFLHRLLRNSLFNSSSS